MAKTYRIDPARQFFLAEACTAISDAMGWDGEDDQRCMYGDRLFISPENLAEIIEWAARVVETDPELVEALLTKLRSGGK